MLYEEKKFKINNKKNMTIKKKNQLLNKFTKEKHKTIEKINELLLDLIEIQNKISRTEVDCY